MKRTNPLLKSICCFCLLIIILLISCSKTGTPTTLDSAKQILSFSLKKADGTAFAAAEINLSITADAVTVTIPAGTDRTQLVPEIAISGVTISPLSGAMQNFTNPVLYTVTAEDGTTANYTVSVKNAEPAPVNNVVYIGSSDNNFYALDALTGVLKWKYQGTESFAYSSATYANGTVYVGGIDSYVYAFDALTGVVKWRFEAGSTGVESDAVVVDGTVYVGSNDDYLNAIDANTGLLKWRFLTGANVSASPVISAGVVYFGSSDNNLYALEASTGNLKWSYATGAMINQSGPALANGSLFVGSRDGYLYSINPVNGTLNWRFSSAGISFEQSSPTVVNGIVYIGAWYQIGNFTRAGSLYAVNAATGQLVWETLQNTGFSSSPVVADGHLFITADDGNIHALDALTGASLWQKAISPNSASPAVANGVVYVGGGGTRFIYAFNTVNGNEVWRFSVPNGLMTSSPLIINASGAACYSGDSGAYN